LEKKKSARLDTLAKLDIRRKRETISSQIPKFDPLKRRVKSKDCKDFEEENNFLNDPDLEQFWDYVHHNYFMKPTLEIERVDTEDIKYTLQPPPRERPKLFDRLVSLLVPENSDDNDDGDDIEEDDVDESDSTEENFVNIRISQYKKKSEEDMVDISCLNINEKAEIHLRSVGLLKPSYVVFSGLDAEINALKSSLAQVNNTIYDLKEKSREILEADKQASNDSILIAKYNSLQQKRKSETKKGRGTRNGNIRSRSESWVSHF